MECADGLQHEEMEKAEDAETLTALNEALAELERGEGCPIEEALPALRERLGINQEARRGIRH